MTTTDLAAAMSTLSGQRCSAACLVQHRTRFILGMIGALFVGIAVGIVVDRGFFGAFLVVALIVVSAPLFDRRILGLTEAGVVQARSSAFAAKPTEMLPPPGTVSVRKFGRNPAFKVGDTRYLGATGAREFAAALARRTPS